MSEEHKASDASGGVSAEAIEKLIRQHVGFSMVAGAIPIPLVDIAAISVIQIDMLSKMAARYHVDFNEERGKSIASSLLGACRTLAG